MLNIFGELSIPNLKGSLFYFFRFMNNDIFRWVGVVGHTLYGDVDIGMSNIDITHSRYQVVDYSAWIR